MCKSQRGAGAARKRAERREREALSRAAKKKLKKKHADGKDGARTSTRVTFLRCKVHTGQPLPRSAAARTLDAINACIYAHSRDLRGRFSANARPYIFSSRLGAEQSYGAAGGRRV